MEKLIRTLTPEIRIVDRARGLVDYVASDESIDSYREVIRAKGWRFSMFKRNAPFVDSHRYESVDRLLGKVVDFKVRDGRLEERVQWAIDVPENELAKIGWRMTEAGYLKAVSVGFYPTRSVSQWSEDKKEFEKQLKELGIEDGAKVNRVFLEQEQVELSAVIIGANPNALAKAYKDDVLQEEDLNTIANIFAERETASRACFPGDAPEARHQEREAFLNKLNQLIH